MLDELERDGRFATGKPFGEVQTDVTSPYDHHPASDLLLVPQKCRNTLDLSGICDEIEIVTLLDAMLAPWHKRLAVAHDGDNHEASPAKQRRKLVQPSPDHGAIAGIAVDAEE